jgi:hypothetical protein
LTLRFETSTAGVAAPVNQHHFLWHIGERPEGCRHRPRHCLLKGCERLFWPGHWRSLYCGEACRRAARRWRCWQASQRYRATENGKQRRREQSQRRRQRLRERQAASADVAASCEGQRIPVSGEDFSTRPCDRPGCYALFALPHEQSCKRFCSVACRLALRRVLDREARYRMRRRRPRCQRVTRRALPPDTS